MTQDRVTKFENEARSLLAAGFTTKSGQSAAKHAASSAYLGARKLVQDVFLELPRETRTAAQEAIYFDLPDTPHNWRPKHAAAIREHLPAAAEHIPTIERLVALYQEIKAAPVVLAERNADGTKVRVPHRSEAFNPELRDQFMAQAPALAASYERNVRAVFADYLDRFGADGVIPAELYPNEARLTRAQLGQQRIVNNLIARHATPVNKRTGYVLDEARLAELAKRYGDEVAMQWFYKTNRKLGVLTNPRLVRDDGANVEVTGTKAGHAIRMAQQVVQKWAPVSREVFHQFPALIYVDGKFTPEADYAKQFDVEADQDEAASGDQPTAAAPALTLETATQEQQSVMLYLESQAVDSGGAVESARLSGHELTSVIPSLIDAGLVESFSRVPSSVLGAFRRSITHTADLTEAGWAFAHAARRARAARLKFAAPRSTIEAARLRY